MIPKNYEDIFCEYHKKWYLDGIKGKRKRLTGGDRVNCNECTKVVNYWSSKGEEKQK